METIEIEAIEIENEDVTVAENQKSKSKRIVLDLSPLLDLADDQIVLQLSSKNPELQFEVDKNNQLIITMPTKDETGNINSELNAEFVIWNRADKLGNVYDSSTGFRMPKNNALKSPDISFILKERLEKLPTDSGYRKIAPDFVLELRSESDALKDLIDKMLEYIDNGVRLGWLLDSQGEVAYIYRLNGNHASQSFDEPLSGEEVLKNFTLNLRNIFGKK